MSKRSEYRRKMREYKRAEETLENYLELINSNLNKCDDSLSGFPNVYTNNENVEGQVIENFNDKSEKFYNELTGIIDKAKSSRDEIYEKKVLAHERYEHYKELYERHSDDDDD